MLCSWALPAAASPGLPGAFGVAVARDFYTVHYICLPDLLGELADTCAEGTYRKMLKQLAQTQLLIIDEWMLYDVKVAEVRDILDIVDRCGRPRHEPRKKARALLRRLFSLCIFWPLFDVLLLP
jgi:hypothetical protein